MNSRNGFIRIIEDKQYTDIEKSIRLIEFMLILRKELPKVAGYFWETRKKWEGVLGTVKVIFCKVVPSLTLGPF